MNRMSEALRLVDKALAELERPAVLKQRVAQCALWLGAAATLALVDMAISLRARRTLEEDNGISG